MSPNYSVKWTAATCHGNLTLTVAAATCLKRYASANMPWFAIRSVYHFGVKADGTNVFEERVVCFEAPDSAAAHRKADAESDAYAKQNNFVVHPEQSGYQQDGLSLIDGYEIWSELFESRESLEQFYTGRYGKYLYTPDPPEA